MPSHACAEREAGGERDAGAEAAGQELRRGRRADHQREDEQHADDLDRLGDGERDERQEQRPDQADRHALGLGEFRLEAWRRGAAG